MTRKSGKHLHATYRTLNSCFDLIGSHQQCILWSPPLEIKPTTAECRSWNSTRFSSHDNSNITLIPLFKYKIYIYMNKIFLQKLYLGKVLIASGTLYIYIYIWGGGKLLFSYCFVDAASRICSKQHSASLGNSYQAFSSSTLLKSRWCNHTIVLSQLQLGRIPDLFYQRLDFHIVDNLLIAVDAFPVHVLTSLSVDEILLPRYMKWSY